MPDGKTPITNFNPNEFKVVDNSKKTVTDFNPNEFKIVGKAPNQLREGDASVVLPKYKTPQDLKIDSAIDFIKQKGGRNGSTIMDSELDVLKDVLKDTRATEDQRKRAIATIQGYDSKHDDNNTMYYNKLEDNGVYVPTALAYGEKPPKGYKVASVWGNQNQSNNDNALTDISKSIFNGVIGAVEGVIDVAQIGKTLITGEESKYLNKLGNTAEALKFNKDKDLDTPILNTEGVEKWSDLLDKDRFDLSPKALWGAFNMAAESLVGFAGGAKGATTITKGGKGFVQGLKGVGKEFVDEFGSVQNAITLGENATKATIFAGSFANQVGSVYESAKDAGLKGRDAAGFATAVAAPMAALDAFWGLDGKVMSELFYNQKKNLLKNVVKEVEKDAAGNITENGFKQLTKEMTIGYSDLVKKGVKEVVKDAVSEGGQEAAQDFTQKAGEQLWDKLTPDERGQFGTDAFNAKSFGDYINSFATSLIPGGGMSIGTQLLRTKHDEQSINAYERVKQGPEAVTALKTDLGQALKNNDINQSEYDQAIFKIDSYDKYHQETKGVNLKPEDERKAFELSFQIQGLKTEIPTNENEISKLDPIPRSKVESKQKQVKELQSELNDIIRQGEIKGEPVVPKKEEERIQKEKEKESKANETKPTPKETRVPKPRVAKVDLEDSEGTTEVKVGSEYKKEPKLPKQPDLKDETRTYDTIDNETFNHTRFPSRTKFKMVVDKLSKFQNKEMSGVIKKKSYKYYDKVSKQWTPNSILEVELEDGKRIRFASSQYHDSKTEEGFRSHTRNERLLGNEEGVPVGLKLIDINNPFGLPTKEGYIPGKKVLKIYNKRTGQFLSWAKETHKGKSDSKKEDGSLVTTAEEGDILKTLEGQRYNEDIKGNEGDIARLIAPKPKPTPTERASDATDKIVEEAKTKVKEQGLNKRRLEIFELLKDVKKLRNNEERELNKELENILLELSESKEKVIKEKKETPIADYFKDRGIDVIWGKEKVKPNLPPASKDFGVTEVIPYDAPERNKYQPKNQLRFGQGAYYEAVWIVGDEDLIELIQSGSIIKKNFTLSTSAKKPVSMDRVKKLESIVGMTAIDAHDRATKLARENRDKNEERIVILGEPKQLIINEDGAENEIANRKVNGEDNVEQEPIITAIKRKARSNKKTELIEAAREANDLIEKATDVINMPISEISTDEKRFQNRDELDKDIVKSISENFDENQFDPIVVWKEGDKTLILAGHHRFEGAKLAGKKSVKVRYFEGEESKAIEFAREKSNANRTLENPVERAKIYRDKLARGESKKSVEEQAKQNEGKNASFYLNIAALNPDGMAISTYNSFKTSEDKSTQKEVEKILDWIGDIRRSYSELTNEHEQELFNFLFKGDAKRITTKSEFKQKVSSIVGTLDFDYSKPLNISRFKNITEGENVYDSEVNSLKNKIYKKQEEIDLINDRFVNPKNDKYVNPSDKDYKSIKKLADEKSAKLNKEQKDLNLKLLQLYQDKGKYLNAGSNQGELFQKVSQRKGDFSKVVEKISKAFNDKNIKVVVDENQFKGVQSTVAGKVSADGKNIYLNPNYAGFDTPIHEGGHILIDAMGYNNKIIQAAIKQLRGTDLYKETKKNYKELSDEELDKEVLSEAIGREGADIFDKVEDRSKFKAYLDYIFDWLKQKLGMDKNIAKSLAKQIIGGIKTKNIEGKSGKEQLQKESKKNPLGARPLKFEQYAAEHGFSYEKETDKIEEASYLLKEAQEERDIAKQNAEDATTDEEAAPLEEILAEKEVALKAAKKNFAIKGKRTFEYNKYRKDFNEIQKLMAEKDIDNYTTEELQDLISKLHSFDNKAAKAVRTEAMLKFAMIATKKQQQVFEGKTGYIAELGKTKDITPLQRRILHHSHFSENNADMQAVSLAFGNAIMDKITDANTKKATHEKLGQKVIAEENKKLGIIGAQTNRFSSDSAKYFEWMSDKDGNLMTIDEAKAKGLSEAKINYLKFTRETIADYRGQLEENNFENAVMQAIRIDKGFMEAYKSEGLLPAFSYYLGGGANNLGKVRIEHNGQIKSYSEIEKEILATANRKSITSMAKALFDLLVANIKARYQLKKGFNVDEKENPLELKGEAEYSLNEKGQLVSKFDKPRAKDRGYSKDFYKAMNQFIDESAHTKHISKIMPLVDSVEYLNKNGYMDEGYVIKPNVAKWIEDWKKLHIFKEQHVNDPVLDASIKAMRNLVASTTMWFNTPANVLNVFMGNYSNWRQENGKVVALGNKRLFGGNAKNRAYGLDLIKKYNLVNQDYDSNATMKAGSILSKIATWGTKVGEYQIQGSLGLGLLTEDEFNSFEYTKDKYGNEVLTVKEGVDEAKIKAKMIQIKNRVTDIQGKYPDEDRRNIMKGEIGKAAFQFKVWMPDWFKERFGAKYINAYGQEKEGTFRQLMRTGIKEMYTDLKKGDFKNIYKNNPSFMSNLKGLATIGTLIALSHMDDDDEEVKKGSLTFQNALSQVLFILDLEQDKYMVSNPVAALGKTKDLISAFEALVTLDEKAIDKVKRVIPGNKITKAYELGKKVID